MKVANVVGKLVATETGGIVVSVILGLGLASLFRQACVSPDCVVVQSPDPQDVSAKVFRYDEGCFRFVPVATRCDN